MLKYRSWIGAVCALALGFLGANPTSAQVNTVPSSALITAPVVAPATAWNTFGSNQTHTVGAAAWAGNPPEIVALARSLGCPGPVAANCRLTPAQYTQNVFDYVRKNIATEFRFGLGKGGRGALIDQSGTPFDQAELMVKLLRQGGLSASYQLGTISLTANQFGQWSGFVTGLSQANQTFSVNAQAACQFLADGGIPLTIQGVSNLTSCSTLSGNLPSSGTALTMGHIWVAVTLNGAPQLYDPSFKTYTLKSGIDVASAVGCGSAAAPNCGSTLQTSGLGSTTPSGFDAGVPYYLHVNDTAAGGVNATLSSYALTLQSYIRANLAPEAQLDDVIGGKEINLAYSPPAGALPYSTALQATWTADVPDQFRTTLGVEDQFLTTQNVLQVELNTTVFADEVAGRRLRFQTPFAPDVRQLWADGVMVASANCATTQCGFNYAYTVTLTAIHPYSAPGYGLDASAFNVAGSAMPPADSITIMFQLGDAGPSTANFYSNLQLADPTPSASLVNSGCFVDWSNWSPAPTLAPVTYSACIHGDQPLVASQYLAQDVAINNNLSNISGVSFTRHHTFGIVFSTNMYYETDSSIVLSSSQTGLNLRSVQSANSLSADPVARVAAFQSAAALSSMIEGSVIQQDQDGWEPISGSTDLVLANRQGQKLYFVQSGQLSNVQPYLTGYPGYLFSLYLQPAQAAGYSFILPQNASLGNFAYNNVSGISIGYNGMNLFQPGVESFLIGGLYGGGNDAPGIVTPDQAALNSIKQMNYSLNQKKYSSVDPNTGDVSLQPPPDLVTGAGEFPYSLPFQRHYNSGSGTSELWNYQMTCLICGPFNSPTFLDQIVYGGPDTTDFARLGGGWTHNYEISASIGNDALAALGEVKGIDASASLAGIYSLFDNNRTFINSQNAQGATPYAGFAGRLTTPFIAYWISKQFISNVVTISRPPSKSVFRRLPDGTLEPPLNSTDSLVQSGARDTVPLAANGGTAFGYNVSLSLTLGDGSVMKFNPNERIQSVESSSGGAYTVQFNKPTLSISSWSFPSGVNLIFNYLTDDRLSLYGYSRQELQSVQNNIGRSLTFSLIQNQFSITPSWQHRNGARIGSVTDDQGRVVSYNWSCANLNTNFFTCETLNVVLPDGSTQTYSYPANANSPDPTILVRPNYRLRQWYTAGNTTTPYELFAYDGLYRVSTLTDILGRQTGYFPGSIVGTESWKRADVVSPLSETTTSWFDQWNDLLQTSDPLGRLTTTAYDNASHLKLLEGQPLGNCAAYSYDLRGNGIGTIKYPAGSCSVVGQTITLNPDPASQIATSAAYPPSCGVAGAAACAAGQSPANTCATPYSASTCNKMTSSVDALGYATGNQAAHTTSYTYDPTTGLPTSVVKPADVTGQQPETDYGYTAYSGTDSNPIQLLSSVTKWVSKTLNKSLVTALVYNPSTYALTTATTDAGASPHLNLRTCFKFDKYGNLVGMSDPRAGSCP